MKVEAEQNKWVLDYIILFPGFPTTIHPQPILQPAKFREHQK